MWVDKLEDYISNIEDRFDSTKEGSYKRAVTEGEKLSVIAYSLVSVY
jgi:hypothetical protein